MASAGRKGGSRKKKMAAFLKDYDREVNRRLERIRGDGERMVKEMEDLYDLAVLQLPPEVLDMNWLEFLAKVASGQTLEEVATANLETAEIDKLTAAVINTPSEIIKKVKTCKRRVEATEEAEPPAKPLPKKSRVDSQCPSETEDVNDENVIPQTAKVKPSTKKPSTKKPPVARGHRSASVKHMSKRSSKYSFVTPVTGRMVDICARGVTSVVTPRFDSRVLRTPALNEHIPTSANGSPLADPRDPVLIVPLGGGECLCLTAEDVTKKNFLQLNREARGLMKNLSVRLAQACNEEENP